MVSKNLFNATMIVLMLGIGISALQQNLAIARLHQELAQIQLAQIPTQSTPAPLQTSAAATPQLATANQPPALLEHEVRMIAVEAANVATTQVIAQLDLVQKQLPPRVQVATNSQEQLPVIEPEVIESALNQIESIRSRGSLSQLDVMDMHSQLAQLDAQNHHRVMPEILNAIGTGEIVLEDGVIF